MNGFIKYLGFCLMIVGSLGLVYCMVNMILLAQGYSNG